MSAQLNLAPPATEPTPCRLGVDVGITGALALICGDSVLALWDMPTMSKSSGKGNQVSAAALARIVEEADHLGAHAAHAYVEAVSAMPKQGVTSMFSLGKSSGIVEGVLAALGVPYTLTAPGSWKRRAGLLGREKAHSVARAVQLYPSVAGDLARKKDIGRAEAILIARFGDPTDTKESP